MFITNMTNAEQMHKQQWLALIDETIVLLFAWLCLSNFLKNSITNMNSGVGMGGGVTVLWVCFLRTTVLLITTLSIQKPHQ